MIPKTIYELLPFIYGPTGIYAVASLDSPLGRISGAMLLSAAAVNHTMRRIYRSK